MQISKYFVEFWGEETDAVFSTCSMVANMLNGSMGGCTEIIMILVACFDWSNEYSLV